MAGCLVKWVLPEQEHMMTRTPVSVAVQSLREEEKKLRAKVSAQ